MLNINIDGKVGKKVAEQILLLTTNDNLENWRELLKLLKDQNLELEMVFTAKPVYK